MSTPTTIPIPSVGRIVHYHDGTHADPQAAMVSGVNGHAVVLTVMPIDRTPYLIRVEQVSDSASPVPGTWCWPPRA